MGLVTFSWFIDATILVLTLVVGVYALYWKQFQFWKKLKVPHTNPAFPLGDTAGVTVTRSLGDAFKEAYDAWKGHRFVGIWSLFRPILLVRDPELIKTIMIKDFMSFHDRGIYVNEKDDPLSAHLFSIGGTKWRNLRAKMTPTFTSGKMKMMFPIVVDHTKELKSLLDDLTTKSSDIEIKEIAARFTTDIISACAFGIQTNSMKNPDAKFRTMGRKSVELNFINSVRLLLSFIVPQFAELFKMRTTPRDVSDFFLGAIRETMDYRENNNVKRNDFLQLLLQLKKCGQLSDVDQVKGDGEGQKNIPFTFEEAAAQIYIFFLAGFETSSTTMQYALYELALNPEIQEKLRTEIRNGLDKTGGEATYEGVHEMDYLGRVIDESMRKYPPVPVLQRECNRDFKIPESDVVIPAGTSVQFSILGMHRDPLHYPNPERFDPDRFTEEEKAKRHHFAYLPFGEGPRNCIGSRFGLMQTRAGLITLLSNYRFEACEKTPMPMAFDPKTFVLSPKMPMYLKVTKLKN